MGTLVNNLKGRLVVLLNDPNYTRYSELALYSCINYAIKKIYLDHLKNGILLESFKIRYLLNISGNSSANLPTDFLKPLEVYRIVNYKKIPIDWGLAGEVNRPNVYVLFDIRNRKIFNYSKILEIRMTKGVKEELIELVSLKGIGRVRARNLYNAGFKTLDDLKKAKIEDLIKVRGIGIEIVKNIKEELS
ncbi:MAG: helix-hairpin-helix domain-containing protein, partial [Candidatus Aenigmatarchaeota archaeon]